MREIDRENLVKHCNRVYITVYILLVCRQQLIQIANTGLAQHVLEWGGGGGLKVVFVREGENASVSRFIYLNFVQIPTLHAMFPSTVFSTFLFLHVL